MQSRPCADGKEGIERTTTDTTTIDGEMEQTGGAHVMAPSGRETHLHHDPDPHSCALRRQRVGGGGGEMMGRPQTRGSPGPACEPSEDLYAAQPTRKRETKVLVRTTERRRGVRGGNRVYGIWLLAPKNHCFFAIGSLLLLPNTTGQRGAAGTRDVPQWKRPTPHNGSSDRAVLRRDT